MAGLFSTATLGLQLNTAAFNSQLQAAGRGASAVFNGMTLGANQFKAAWDDATRGIKDTKRIISGILISQGFYALMNGLSDAGAAALTFSMNMETAAVSMEYFMEGSDKAAKSLAYLREMNEFAARTPFSTEAALELSKYIQAVGIGTQYTKSFLQVVTDAAAATGATTENLQRVVFALGQMKTKGRIANEEIRQLANANIPIYEILQEELGLTGDQISNIGKYWVDADKAIVAILDGLDKRYKGAADRISNTVTGMLDTIKDDALIITQQAGSELYDELSDLMSKVRDKLGEYRDVATETGGFGLFNHVLLDIDPSGETGTEILVLIGNVQQLISALGDLYVASRPLISAFSKGLYAGINTATVVMTSFSRVLEDVENGLAKLGISSGDLGAKLTQLYIMYRAGKWALTLGQGALYAATSLFSLGKSVVVGLVPALNAGSVSAASLTANLIWLAAAGAAISLLLGNMNKFAGLDMDMGEAFPTDYEQAMNDYLAAMEEYNEQIAKYQEQFNTPYDEMADGSATAIEGLEDTAAASKKAAKSVKHDWVAAFDEVYQVPTFNDAAGSAGKAPKLPDLGEFLKKAKFKFPAISVDLKKPELEDFFDNGLLDRDVLNADWWKGMLPALITIGVIGAATHFKKPGYDIDTKGGAGKPIDPNTPQAVRKAAAQIVSELEDLKRRALAQSEELAKRLDERRKLGTSLEGADSLDRAMLKSMTEIQKKIDARNALVDGNLKPLANLEDIKALQSSVASIDLQYKVMRQRELAELLESGRASAIEQAALEKELKQINTALKKTPQASIAPDDLKHIVSQFNDTAATFFKNLERLNIGRATGSSASALDVAIIKELETSLNNMLSLGDNLSRSGKLTNELLQTEAGRLYSAADTIRGSLKGIDRDVNTIQKLVNINNTVTEASSKAAQRAAESTRHALSDDLKKVSDRLTTISETTKRISDKAIDDADKARAQREADKAKHDAEVAQQKAEAAEKARQEAIARGRAAAAQQQGGVRTLDNKQLLEINQRTQDTLEMVERDTAAIKELEAYTQQSSSTHLRQIEGLLEDLQANATDNALSGDAYNAAQDGVLKELVKRVKAYSITSGETSFPKAIRKAFKDTIELGGISEEEVKRLTSMLGQQYAVTTDALQLISGSLRRTLLPGFYPGKGASGLTEKELNMLLSNSSAARASLGLGPFEGSIPDAFITAFGDDFQTAADAMRRSASQEVEIAAAIGRYTQALGLATSGMQWSGNGAKLSAGGYAQLWDKEGLAALYQIDAELGIIRRGNQTTIPVTVTSASQRVIDTLNDNAKWLALEGDTAVNTLSADIIKAVNPELYAQMGHQLSVDKGTATGLSVLNRSYIAQGKALDRLTEAFNNAIHAGPAKDAPFAIENVRKFANYFPDLREADPMTQVDAFMKRIIMPFLGVPEHMLTAIDDAIAAGADKAAVGELVQKAVARIDFGLLSDMYNTYVVEYTLPNLKELKAASNARALRSMNKLMQQLIASPEAKELFNAYVKLNGQFGDLAGQIVAINANSGWRQIGRLNKGTKRFVDNILKTNAQLKGYISGPFKTAVDTAIAQFQDTLVEMQDISELPAAVGKFQNDILDYAKRLRNYTKEVDDVLLAGSTMTHESMVKVAEALESLADRPLDVDKLPMIVRSVNDLTVRLNGMIAGNAAVTEEAVDMLTTLGKQSEMLYNYFHVDTAMSVRAHTAALEDYISTANDALRANAAIINGETDGVVKRMGDLFKPLPELISPLNAIDSYYAMAHQLLGMIDSGSDIGNLLSSDDIKRLREFAGQRPDSVPTDIHNLRRPAIEPATGFFDTETNGLFARLRGMLKAPDVLQVATINADTGTVGSFNVSRGAETDAAYLDIIKRIPKVGEAWQDVSLEQFRANAVDESLVRKTLASLLDGQTMSGYNATNIGRVGGGFDYKVLLDNFGYDTKITRDVMTKAARVFERYTGSYTTTNLEQLVEAIFGVKPEGTHIGANDAALTQLVDINIDNGRLEAVITNAMSKGIKGKNGLFDALVQSARELNEMGQLPDNLLGSSGVRVPFNIPGLPGSTVENVVNPALDAARAAEAEAEAAKAAVLAAERAREAERIAEAARAAAAADAAEAARKARMFNAVDEAGGLAGDAAARAARAAGNTGGMLFGNPGSLANTIKQFFGSIGSSIRGRVTGASTAEMKYNWGALRDNFGTFFRRNFRGVSGVDIGAAFDKLYDASKGLNLGELRTNVFNLEDMVKAGTASKDQLKAAQRALDEALKQYEPFSKQFFRDVTDQLIGGLKNFSTDKDFVATLLDIQKAGKSWQALFIDPQTGIPGLIGDTLWRSSDEIFSMANSFATNELKRLGKIAKDAQVDYDAIAKAFKQIGEGVLDPSAVRLMNAETQEVFDALRRISEAVKNGNVDDLDDFAKAFYNALNSFGDNKVFTRVKETMNAAGEVVSSAADVGWAGAQAAKGINHAADVVGSSFKGLFTKMVNGVANFGIIDIGIAGLQGWLQHKTDIDYGKQFNEQLIAADSSAAILHDAGVDVGKMVSDELFHGAMQEVFYGLSEGLVSSVTFTAVSAAASGIIGAKLGGTIGTAIAGPLGTAIGAVIGAAAGYITSSVIDSLNGRTATSRYLDDYTKALSDGSMLTTDMLQEMCDAMGITTQQVEELGGGFEGMSRALKEAGVDVDAMEDRLRAQATFITMGQAEGTGLEAGKVNNVLYGSSDTSNITSDTALALRTILSLGLVDGIGAGTFGNVTEYVDYDGWQDSFKRVVITDPEILEQLKNGTFNVEDSPAFAELEKLLGVNLDIKEITVNGITSYALANADTGQLLSADITELDNFAEIFRLMYQQGSMENTFAENMQRVLDNNPALKEAVGNSVGVAAMAAAEHVYEYLDMFNAAAGTSYDKYDLENNQYLAEAVMRWATDMVSTGMQSQRAYMAELGSSAAYGTSLTAAMSGDKEASRLFWGADLEGVGDTIIKQLAESGLVLSQGNTTLTTASGEDIEQPYVTMDFDMDTFKDALAGVRIDATSIEGLDVGALSVTAEEADILAQAGIRINGDGTVDFMNAHNEGATGATRDLNIGAGAISDHILKALEEKSFVLNFEAGEFTFDPEEVGKDMYGAMFKLPDDWESKTSDEVKKALETVGDLMDSGYFMITDKALLNGDKTLTAYLQGVLGADHVSDDVADIFGRIDEIIQMEGNTALTNITEWADAIVVPSPFSKDEITPEIEAMFAQAGVTFTEYGNQFLMVVNETGEKLLDGMTLMDAATWNKLPDSLRAALEAMGVQVTTIGNQVMIDLNTVMEGGVGDVISLFIDQPELWNQIPEALRNTLSTSVIATEDGFLEIKNRGHDQLVQLGNTWVADWTMLKGDTLKVLGETNNGTKVSLEELSRYVDNGLMQIKGVVNAADIPELADDEIAVPFDELPDEVKSSLTGPGGLSENLDGALVVVKNVANTGFGAIVAEAQTGSANMSAAANEMVQNIKDAVVQAQLELSKMELIRQNVGKSGGSWFFNLGAKDNSVNFDTSFNTSVTRDAKGYIVPVYTEYDSDGKAVAWHYVDPVTGKPIRTTTKPTAVAVKAEGGPTEGLTLAGEQGREIAILPDGSIKMIGDRGGAELLDLPHGTRILNNEDTETVMQYTGDISKLATISNLTTLADGNTELTVDAAAPERGDDEFHTVFLAFMKAFIAKYGSEVTEEGNDITGTEVEATHTDDAAHYIAENHAVAIRGFSAALFEFLEAWRNDKAGLEALGNTISTSIVDNSTKVVDAVKTAGDSITEAVRGIRLSVPSSYSSSNVSKYTAPIGLESLGDVAATDEDGEPYNWIEDVIKAQKMYAAATTDEERKAAHDLAERARATQGFSGGPDGSQFIPTGGKQTAWVQEVFAAQRDYKYATSDAERMLAHARAEAARATQGFSGGSDGSKFIITEAADKVLTSLKPMLNEETQKEVTQLTEQLKPVQESTKKTTEGVTQFSQSLTVQLNELLGKWSAQDLSTKEAIVSAVAAGCSEVAAAVGAYVDWSQSTIKSLENQVSALQAAASHEQRSSASVAGSKKPKGSAKGSLVTEDALYRAGELGLNEAIVPLEQPDVMSLVGSTIAEYMPEGEGSTVVLNDQAAMVEAILAQTDTITVAIRGAVAAITEDQQNHSDHVVLQVEKIINTVDTNLKKLDALDKLSDLASSINDLGNSVDGIGNLINSTSNAMNSMNEDLTVLKTELDSKTNTEDVEALPAAISAEFGKWWTDSMAAARNMYATSTDDAGRREAHAKAEDLRALLGYSGGPDGSQYIPLGNGRTNGSSEEIDFATNETLARLSTALSEQLTTIWNAETTRDKEHSEKMVSQLDRLYTLVREVAGSLDATMQASASSIVAAVADGSSMVASAVGSYVNWSQSTIKSLENQVASLQMAASMSARSSSSVTGSKGGGSIKNIRGSAKGSLVTEDALYRAGEGGLNEAIVPLEQPAVMSKVGNAIADAMPGGNGSVYDLTTPDAPVDTGSIVESLNANTEVIALAIRGAVAAITENAANHTDGLMVNIDAINATVAENLSKLDSLDTLSSAVGSLGSDISGMGSTMNSVSSAVSGVGNAVQNVSATLESLAPMQAQETTVEQLPEQLGATINTTLEGLAAELIERGRSMYAGAGTDEERARAHETAELGRALLGYSGGPDGSEHIPLDETSTAATIELLNSGMSILADYGTIIGGMLEAQNVLSSDLASTALASSTSFHTQDIAQAEADTNKMFQLETAKFDSQFNLTAEQTRSMSAGMLAQTGALITTFNAGMNYLGSTITAGANYVAAQVGSYVRYAENTMASQRQQIAQLESSLAAAWSAAASASKSGGGSGGSSKSSSSSSSKGKGSSALSTAVKNTVSKVVSTIGGKLSGKKGSARGSLVTEDALYRAGEFGLNEAIIPLERPDVLRQVGASIASFMPVEQRTSMGMAAGMTNGGISPYSTPAPQEDPNMMAGAITQRVLESVLPAMYAMQDDTGEDRRPLYVGTLIADERGLQQLERKLYDIRKVEATRR